MNGRLAVILKKKRVDMDINEIGLPKYWSLDAHVKAVEQMIRADEIQIALRMLDDVPAWYRKNRPPELEEIRKKLYENLYDAFDYGNDDEEAEFPEAEARAQWRNGYCFPRAEIITALVKKLNKAGETPWIFDLGCSHGNLLYGLFSESVSFQYLGKSINWRIAQRVSEIGQEIPGEGKGWRWKEKPDANQKTILFCSEVIEHMMNPMDAVQSAYKMGVRWDYILLSVPLGCLGGGLENWDTRRLGHVRGWTEQEFFDFANKHWPGYGWQLTVAPSMVLLGERNG